MENLWDFNLIDKSDRLNVNKILTEQAEYFNNNYSFGKAIVKISYNETINEFLEELVIKNEEYNYELFILSASYILDFKNIKVRVDIDFLYDLREKLKDQESINFKDICYGYIEVDTLSDFIKLIKVILRSPEVVKSINDLKYIVIG